MHKYRGLKRKINFLCFNRVSLPQHTHTEPHVVPLLSFSSPRPHARPQLCVRTAASFDSGTAERTVSIAHSSKAVGLPGHEDVTKSAPVHGGPHRPSKYLSLQLPSLNHAREGVSLLCFFIFFLLHFHYPFGTSLGLNLTQASLFLLPFCAPPSRSFFFFCFDVACTQRERLIMFPPG